MRREQAAAGGQGGAATDAGGVVPGRADAGVDLRLARRLAVAAPVSFSQPQPQPAQVHAAASVHAADLAGSGRAEARVDCKAEQRGSEGQEAVHLTQPQRAVLPVLLDAVHEAGSGAAGDEQGQRRHAVVHAQAELRLVCRSRQLQQARLH